MLHKTLLGSSDGVEIKPRRLHKAIQFFLFIPLYGWGFFALWLGSWTPIICQALAIIYLIAHPAALIFSKRRSGFICTALFMLPLLSFLFLMRPSHEREWQADVAKLPWAEIEGNQVVLHNVRDTEYQSTTNFTVKYETRIYNINELESVDVSLTDWGVHTIAHTMVSFGFKGDRYLCFSIEARKEVGEDYSSTLGFFRQFELIYIAADENDLIKLRTCYRKNEEVRMYRMVKMSKEHMTYIFNGYMERINSIKNRAEWYNALTQNCMTSMIKIARGDPDKEDKAPLHWSMIANGYSDQHAYKLGTIDNSLPFEELRKQSIINEKANRVKDASEFSKEIRHNMPGIQTGQPAK